MVGAQSLGMGIVKRRGMAKARVAVTRKLTVILHRMWNDQTEFRQGKVPAGQIAWEGPNRIPPGKMGSVVSMATKGKTISLRPRNLSPVEGLDPD